MTHSTYIHNSVETTLLTLFFTTFFHFLYEILFQDKNEILFVDRCLRVFWIEKFKIGFKDLCITG